MNNSSSPTRLVCGSRVLDLSVPMSCGILNVTPIPFPMVVASPSAMRHCGTPRRWLQQGYADRCGESTRRARVQFRRPRLERVAPIVEAIAGELDVVISVDTSTPAVIRECARLGAGLINDVRSLRRDGALDAAADTGLPVCLMHMRGEPGDMQDDPRYDDITAEVASFLGERMAACGGRHSGRAHRARSGVRLCQDAESQPRAVQAYGKASPTGASAAGGRVAQEHDRWRAGASGGGGCMEALRWRPWPSARVQIVRVHDVAETVDVIRMIAAVQAAE